MTEWNLRIFHNTNLKILNILFLKKLTSYYEITGIDETLELLSNFITPGDKLYHRTHNNMPPRADLSTYHLKIFNLTSMVPRTSVTFGSED